MNTTGFGSRLREAREAKGMNQGQLAKAMRITQPMISKWEDKNSDPRISTVISIAGVLGVSPSWLAFGKG